jgi:hypothetical protein
VSKEDVLFSIELRAFYFIKGLEQAGKYQVLYYTKGKVIGHS